MNEIASASGASSFAQGGNRESALMSMGLAITGLTASKIYQSVVKYDIDIASGGSAQGKRSMGSDSRSKKKKKGVKYHIDDEKGSEKGSSDRKGVKKINGVRLD